MLLNSRSEKAFQITDAIDMKPYIKILALIAMLLPAFSCSDGIDPDGPDNPGKDDPSVNLASGYRRQMVAMQFTSVGCVNCPFLSDAIKEVQKNFPGRVIPVAFHMDYGSQTEDPMALPMNDKLYKRISHSGNSLSLPMFAFNFRKSSQPIVNEYDKIVSEMELEKKENHPVCGVAIETSYDESSRKAVIKARFNSDVQKDYRYHILLLEDGIEYMQMGSDNGKYVHDNVLRHYFADHIYGVKLNDGEALEPGKEYVVEKSLVLDKEWKASNVRVVVAAMCSSDMGMTYYSNNANVCALGKSVGYLYEK